MRIPVAEPTVQTNIAPMPQLAGDGWGAPGRATQQLGQSIASLGDALGSVGASMNAEAEKEAKFKDQLTMYETDNKIGLAETQSKIDYDGDGEDYVERRNTYYDDTVNEALSRISPANQAQARVFFEQRRGPVIEGAARFGGQRKQDVLVDRVSKAIEPEFGKLANAPPDQFDAQYQSTMKGVNAIIGKSALPDNIKDKLSKSTAETALKVIKGLAENPETAPDMVPKLLEFIDGAEKAETQSLPDYGRGLRQFGAEGVQGESGSQSGPAPIRPQSNVGPSFSPSIDKAIDAAAANAGVDQSIMRVFARIESSGNPTVTTGSYKGLFQLSNSEFAKYGGKGNIYDPVANATAAAAKLKAESAQFAQKYGRQPTAADLYLVHQQGEGGAAAHFANPDKPAWENMASTGEGRQKGDAWAKKAIWGNVPSDVRAKYGSVENISSREFVGLWTDKIAKFSGGTAVAPSAQTAPDGQPAQTGPATLSQAQMAKLANVKPELVDRLGKLQAAIGQELPINSGFRDKGHNAKVGGAKGSQHVHGNAVDLNVRNLSKEQRVELIKQASALGITGIGVYDNAIHLDMGNRRAWGPDHSSGSVPKWARGVIAEHNSGQAVAAAPVANRGLTEYAGLSKLGAGDVEPPEGARASNTIPGPSNDNAQPEKLVQVADASGRTVPQVAGSQQLAGQQQIVPSVPRWRPVDEYLRNMLILERPEIVRKALEAERAAEALERKQITLEREKAHREGLELFYGRRMTRDWIEENKDRLSNENYSTFMRAVTPKSSATDPETYRDMLERADESPDDIIREAGEAYAHGLLNQDAFDRVYSKATRALNGEAKKPAWVSEQRQLIKRSLRPDVGASPEETKAYTSALEQFDAYVDEATAQGKDKDGRSIPGKGLDRKSLTDFSQGLVTGHKTSRVMEQRKTLSLPRYTQVGRETMTYEELQSAIKKTADAYKSGKITKSELAIEVQNLKKWEDALKAEAAAAGKPIKPMQPPAPAAKPVAPKQPAAPAPQPDANKAIPQSNPQPPTQPEKSAAVAPIEKTMTRLVRDSQGTIVGLVNEPYLVADASSMMAPGMRNTAADVGPNEAWAPPTSTQDTGATLKGRVINPPATGDDGIVQNQMRDKMLNESHGIYGDALKQNIDWRGGGE